MAQLDRLLSVMTSNRADLLRLTESDVAKLHIGASSHPVTKQTLTAAQLIALLREIAPPDAMKLLEAGKAASFGYISDDGVFFVDASRDGGKWVATLRVDEDARAKALTDAFTVVEERAPVEQMTPVQGHPRAPFGEGDASDERRAAGAVPAGAGAPRPAPFKRPQPAAATAESPAAPQAAAAARPAAPAASARPAAAEAAPAAEWSGAAASALGVAELEPSAPPAPSAAPVRKPAPVTVSVDRSAARQEMDGL